MDLGSAGLTRALANLDLTRICRGLGLDKPRASPYNIKKIVTYAGTSRPLFTHLLLLIFLGKDTFSLS